jgi:hypothetical protein
MTKTLVTTIISISLVSLSACQTARVQSAKSTDPSAERNIAQAPVEGALELVFKNLATTAGADTASFDRDVLALVNANKSSFGIKNDINSMADLDLQFGNKPKAFLNRFAKLPLSSLNISTDQLSKAATQQFQNAEATTAVSTVKVKDLTNNSGPLSEATFTAPNADPADVKAIVAAEQDMESTLHFQVVGKGCDKLQDPKSIANLAKIVADTDAAVKTGSIHTQDEVAQAVEKGIAKETGADADGACERFRELNDPTRCAVFVLPTQVCTE